MTYQDFLKANGLEDDEMAREAYESSLALNLAVAEQQRDNARDELAELDKEYVDIRAEVETLRGEGLADKEEIEQLVAEMGAANREITDLRADLSNVKAVYRIVREQRDEYLDKVNDVLELINAAIETGDRADISDDILDPLKRARELIKRGI